jgi:hypothetical protein
MRHNIFVFLEYDDGGNFKRRTKSYEKIAPYREKVIL